MKSLVNYLIIINLTVQRFIGLICCHIWEDFAGFIIFYFRLNQLLERILLAVYRLFEHLTKENLWKKLFLVAVLSALVSACSVGVGAGGGSNGVGVGVGLGTGFGF